MQHRNLPDPWEETTTQTPKNPIEFTVKPTGEFTFKGSPNPDLVRQLIVSNDYHQDQYRRHKSETEQRIDSQAQMTNYLTIGFLGTSILVLAACLILSANKGQNQQNQGNINYDGQFIRGTSCR